MALPATDTLEIIALLGRYSHTIDGGDGAGFAACFTADGEWTGPPGAYSGTQELTDFVTAYHRDPGAKDTRHQHANIVIDGEGLSASVLSDCSVVGPDAGLPITLILTCRYRDEVVKSDAGWRFKRRAVVDMVPNDIELELDG